MKNNIAIFNRSLLVIFMGLWCAADVYADELDQSKKVEGLSQESVSNTDAQTNATKKTKDARRLSNVVVTAKKKEQELAKLQTAAPVEVINSEDIKASGSDNLIAVLQRLVPSANIPLGAANTFSSARIAKSVSLHGLGPEETLVLVDGKRWHLSALVNTNLTYGRGAQAVDLNSIPLSAIDRIEVLKDGASAQYGSDAIAGVVNIILKKDNQGGDFSVQVGNYIAKDKPEGKPENTTIYKGFLAGKFLESGYINTAFEVNNIYHPADGLPDPRRFYFPNDPRENTIDKGLWPAHFPADENSSKGTLSIGAPLGDSWNIYSFINYSHSYKEGRGFYNLPNSDSTVRAIYPDGYKSITQSTVDDSGAALGVKYEDKAFGKLDISYSTGRYDQNLDSKNGVNAGLGLNTPIGYHSGEYISSQNSLDATWNNAIAVDGLNNPLSLAAGVSYRDETYEIHRGEYASYAKGALILDGPNKGKLAPSAGGVTPQDEGTTHRNARGVWVNIENQISKKLLLGVSGRAEDYSDFGATQTGKIWSHYSFTDTFSTRASFSSGYRAPSLAQLAFSSTGYTAVVGDFVQTRGLPVSSPIAQALGAKELTPEESTNAELGFIWKPSEQASLSLDFYHVNIQDRITLSENLSGAKVTQLLTKAGYPEVRIANFFLNALDTKTHGYDLVGSYDFDFEKRGTLDLNFSYSANKTVLDGVRANPDQIADTGLILVSRRVQGLYTDYTPKDKLIVGGRYKLGQWELSFTEKRYGEFSERHQTNPAFDQTYNAQWISDLSSLYRFDSGIYITLGVNNIFNSRPERQRAELSVGGNAMSKYSDLAPEGMDGTYYYGNVGLKF